jgi:hypothetical protein
MQSVFRAIKGRAARLSRHALFVGWLDDPSLTPEEKLGFVPMGIDFIMGFRDFNHYFVIYPSPRDELEAALNEHAREDATHSLLLLQDWAALGVDARLGWAPRDLYWWMTSEQTARARRLDFELTSLVYHSPDPLLRFAIIESMEAAGNVFFTRTVPVADAFTERTGVELPYFGKYHLDRETGHLQHGDERAFFRAPMGDAQRERACSLVERVFDLFEQHFDTWVSLARARHEGRWRFSAAAESRALGVLRPGPVEDLTRYLQLEHPAGAEGPARALIDERARAFDRLWSTPFYQWIRTALPGDFTRMTRLFLLQWVVDNWACADYFAFDTTYAEPRTALERGINRLSTLYASEMNRRHLEWERLDLDAFTGWSPHEALRHYWLDEDVALHREIFADLRKLTFRFPEPLHRYWIMKCFVRFGDTLMRSLGEAMKVAHQPDEDFIGFAGHPERMHPALPPDPEADLAIAGLELQPTSAEDQAILREIIREVADQEARRSAASWSVVQRGRYEALDQRWSEREASVPLARAV